MDLELPQCHFFHILLFKASHKANSHQVEKQTPPLYGRSNKVALQNRCVYWNGRNFCLSLPQHFIVKIFSHETKLKAFQSEYPCIYHLGSTIPALLYIYPSIILLSVYLIFDAFQNKLQILVLFCKYLLHVFSKSMFSFFLLIKNSYIQ